ncbi:acetyl-CoA carboxylase biotin carboxyl carrier protein [Sphingopyxis sp. NJF-3]
MNLPVDDVRFLLGQFAKSPWRDLHCRTGAWTVFMAKPGGAANPLRAAVSAPAAPPRHDVTAPHLGLFARLVTVGDRVASGTPLCRLEKLDEHTDVVSDRDGRVVAIHRRDGDLVEYGEPLVEIEAV